MNDFSYFFLLTPEEQRRVLESLMAEQRIDFAKLCTPQITDEMIDDYLASVMLKKAGSSG